MQYKPSKWVSGYKHGPAASYTQITRMGLFLNVATSKFEPLDSTWDNLHSGGMFISDDNKIYFRDETNKDIYINSNADNEITIAATSGVTISGGNLIIGTAGKGIDFSNQSAGGGMTAELLDHYEEGLHTSVTVVGSTSGNYVLAAAADTFAYTKIGRICHVQGEIKIDSDNSASGNLRISLPFASASLSESSDICFGVASIEGQGNTIAGRLYARSMPGTSYFTLYAVADGGGAANVTNSDVDTLFWISVNLTYTVA